MMYDGKKWVVIANWGQPGRKETIKVWPKVVQAASRGNARLNAFGTLIGVLTSFAFYKAGQWDSQATRIKELADANKQIGSAQQEIKALKEERTSMQEALEKGKNKGWFW